jgi:hypothetical protein
MFQAIYSKQPELKIRLPSGLDFSLALVTESTTIFEVKQAIERLKSFKIDQQILQLEHDRDLALNDDK